MRNSIISNRYAKALFDFALEKDHLEQVRKDMELILKVIHDNRDLRLLFRSPVINPEKKELAVTAIFKDSISELSLRYLLIIIKKRREAYIEGIAEEFVTLYKIEKHITTTKLETAAKLDRSLVKRVTEIMKKQTGGEIELLEQVRKELIGGFVLSYDDKKYDASIARQISDLKKEFEINLYERKL